MKWLVTAVLYIVALGIGVSPIPSGGDEDDKARARERSAQDQRARAPAPSRASFAPPPAPPPAPRPPPPPAPVARETRKLDRPEPGPCKDDLRISGAAYVPPERGRPLVVFSGADVRRSGARSVGMRIADKTLVGIYPNVAVLADDAGALCFVKMYGLHAQEVAEKERREATRKAFKQQREDAKKKAALRAAARKKRTKR